MAMTVTATQGGSTAPGLALRVKVLTGAKKAAQQTGASAHAEGAEPNQVGITTTAAGSLVYCGVSQGDPAWTPVSGCTTDAEFNDTANGEAYGCIRTTSATVTPGAITVGLSSVSGGFGDIAAAEILPAATLAEDASGPAISGTGTDITVTTASFTPPPGSLLVACIGSDGAADFATDTTMSVTDSAGLTWIPLAQAASPSTCYAGVFVADVPAGGNTPAPFFPATQPARSRISRGTPRAGSITAAAPKSTGNVSAALNGAGTGGGIGSAGGQVRNPVRGPAFFPAVRPVQARLPLASQRITGPAGPRGRVYGISRGAAVTPPPPVTAGPPFTPRVQALRAAPPPARRGRTASNPGGPVANQPPVTAGPPFRPRTQALRAPAPPPRRGRTASNPGAPAASTPPVTSGPPFRPRTWAIRAAAPLPRRGRAASGPGGPVANPDAVPSYGSMPGPVRAALPVVLRGRVALRSLTAPSQHPSPGPAFRPFTSAVRAALPPRPFLKGRTSASPGSAPRNPSAGPAFRQQPRPVQARIPLPPRGRTASNPGGPVVNPVPPVLGPVFFPKPWPARIRPSLPPRGRTAGSQGAPARNPAHGAAFPAAHGPAQARFPLPPRGRTAGNPGIPAVPPQVPAPVFPQHGPVRARFPLPPRGRTASGPGGPLVTSGPAFRPVPHPVQARIPLPPRGRAAGSPGGPVQNPATHTGAPFFPRPSPARVRPVLPPRGRIAGSPGSPVRNPSHGPVFTPEPWPARARIPQNAPRGRTGSDPGGPVANIPVNRILISTGDLFVLWETGTLLTLWETGGLFTSQ